MTTGSKLHIILVVATTADGFITIGNDPRPGNWTSAEDKTFLSSLISEAPLVVMGWKTYDVHRPKPTKHQKLVVLSDRHAVDTTHSVDSISTTPQDFCKRYAKYKECLLLGGAQTYRQFLKAGVVSEAYVTVEPVRANGEGIRLLQDGEQLSDFSLSLVGTRTLNTRGTVLEHYRLK